MKVKLGVLGEKNAGQKGSILSLPCIVHLVIYWFRSHSPAHLGIPCNLPGYVCFPYTCRDKRPKCKTQCAMCPGKNYLQLFDNFYCSSFLLCCVHFVSSKLVKLCSGGGGGRRLCQHVYLKKNQVAVLVVM